jgi:hypothetical protein
MMKKERWLKQIATLAAPMLLEKAQV